MTVNWSGMGETQDPNYELMSLYVDGGLVGSAHAARKAYQADGMMPDWAALSRHIDPVHNTT